MAADQHHVIRRHCMDVEVRGTERDGFEVHRRLPALCGGDLLTAIADILDRAARPDEHLLIERLEVDAGMVSLENLERDLPGAVAQALHNRLTQIDIGSSSGTAHLPQRKSRREGLNDAFLHFLSTGLLPWWFRLPTGQTLETVLLEYWRTQRYELSRAERQRVLDALGAQDARTRLTAQFSSAFRHELLHALSPDCAAAIAAALENLQRNGSPEFPAFTAALWRQAFLVASSAQRPTVEGLVADSLGTLSGEDSSHSSALAAARKVWPEMISARESTSTSRKEPVSTDAARLIDIDKGVHVDNAGLVILHPFLAQLFTSLAIAREDVIRERDRALCLLHFLATGTDTAPEYELLLPKVMCGVDPEIPVESVTSLTESERHEGVAMLEAVIRHWTALGDTSPDALRGTFLLRPGKLSRRDDGDFVLHVEPASFDILMDALPWGIGCIKLPWMRAMLWVEWPNEA